jgi:transcriptional regulator with XRE-family HTH domain
MARYKRKSPKKLAGKLREIRLWLDMTQQQVADHLGTDASSISRFERGIRDPSLLEILGYSYMSGVGVDVLIDDKKSLAKKRQN